MSTYLSPQINITDTICRKLAPIYRREFGEVERMQAKGDGAREEALEALKKLELLAAKEIKNAYPSTPIVIRDLAPIPDQGTCWAIHMTGGVDNFMHGLSPVCMMFLFIKDGTPFSAMVYYPLEDETYTIEKGTSGSGPVYRLRVNAAKELTPSSIVNLWSSPTRRGDSKGMSYAKHIQDHEFGLRITGNAIHDILQCASGKIDGFIGEHLAPEINLFADLVIKESAGVVTDKDGDAVTKDSETIVASNLTCHKSLLELVQ
ncbi:MAG: inositol monophosphatase family protein [Pseudomonadota bacterium]|nr:inositol monophosphatase family protein [Pseudomonadota bacterium]